MKKPSQTPANNSQPSPTAPSLPSLDHVAGLAQPERITLYATTEETVRVGFLLQGKILTTLAEEGTELLKAAGIKPSSLVNARKAQWVLETFSKLQPVVLFGRSEGDPQAFDEAFYDTLTLHQCELLQKAFTLMGIVKHRPSIGKARELVQHANWPEQLDCWFEHGTDLVGLNQRRQEAEQAAEAERLRIQEMEAEIARLQAAAVATPPPPPPSAPNIPEVPSPPVGMEGETETEMTTEDNPPPAAINIVPFVTPSPITAIEEDITAPVSIRVETEAAEEDEEPVNINVSKLEETPEDPLTPEDIGAALAAVGPLPTMDHLIGTVTALQDEIAGSPALEIADLSELQSLRAEFMEIVNVLDAHIARKEPAPTPTPAPATPNKKSRKRQPAAA